MTSDSSRLPSFSPPIFRFLILLAFCFVAVFAGAGEALAATKKKKKAKYTPPAYKYASIVIEADTGQVLLADNPDLKAHPASLTKMMTLLLAFDALAEKRLKLNDRIRISRAAAAAPPSRLGIQAGGTISVSDAIRAVSVKSANDIAVALGEAIAGTESRFAQKMTLRARGIGMTNTHFVNASGLHSPYQVSTARDMAKLGRYIIQTYPQHYRYFSLRSFAWGGRNHPNHNKLMNTYPGMDGMKTGFINASGYNLVASAVRGDRRLIGVVFGGRTANTRNVHMAALLDQGFAKPRSTKLDVQMASAPSVVTDTKQPPIELPIADFAPLAPIDPQVSVPAARAVAAIPARKPDLSGSDPARASASGVLGSLPAASLSAPAGAPVKTAAGNWAIQIGAYQTREATDQALGQAMKRLPAGLSHASAVVAPFRTVDSQWMFRARLSNFTHDQAARACTLFRGCLLIAPEAY